MEKTLQEKIEEYKLTYVTPFTFYTKKEKGSLSSPIVLTPNLFDYIQFTGKVVFALFYRTAILFRRTK